MSEAPAHPAMKLARPTMLVGALLVLAAAVALEVMAELWVARVVMVA